MKRTTTNIMAALVVALLIGACQLLDGPSEIEAMQLVADESKVRVVLP